MSNAFKTFALFVTMAAGAIAQTTQPVLDDWGSRTGRFVGELVNGDLPMARQYVADQVTVVRGGSTPEQAELATLSQRVRGGVVLSSRGYTFPPIALAADLAADFKSSPAIGDELKEIMVPADDDAMRRANATAIQWIANQLGATPGMPFSVSLVLPATTGDTQKLPTPILILTRGTTVVEELPQINRVVFGTPTQLME